MKRNPVGRPKGQKGITGQATANARRKIDLNIRRIFEEHATSANHLREALDYLFEHDKILYVHVVLKLQATNTTASPVQSVTNVFAESIDARRIIQHVEELASLPSSTDNAPALPHELVLPADDGSGTH